MDRGFELAFAGFVAATLAYGALALRLVWHGYLGADRGSATFAFLLATGASAAWGAAGVAATLAPGSVAEGAVAVADVLCYAAWFAFLLRLLRPAPQAGSRPDTLRVAAWALVATALLTLAAPPILALEPGARWTLLPPLAQPVLGLVLVEQLFRGLRRDHRWGIKPLCIGLAGVFAFDLYIYSQAVLFGQFDADAFTIRAGIHTLAVPMLLIAARRQADWRMKLQVSHSAAFFSATLLLAGAYLLFISAIGYYVRFFGGDWGRALQLAVLFTAIVLLGSLLLSGALRAKLRVFVSKNFFAYRYDYREQWLRFTETLSTSATPRELGSLVVRGLAEMVDCRDACLWTASSDRRSFGETAWTKPFAPGAEEPADSPLATFLREQAWIIDVDEARRHPERYDGLVLPEWFSHSAVPIWACVPLLVGERLTGFALLAAPHGAIELDWEVRDLLKTASRQAAAFLAQLQATEALLEARKFEAFNRMSAFVVHDLKNIVTQLSLLMKNAQRLHDNPEFQKDMLATVEHSLDKMRQLMLQLREGGKPVGTLAGVELQPIVRRIAHAAQQRGRVVDITCIERLATRGHEERIERVIGHLVHNALDATPPKGRVWIELMRASGSARIVVGDTGAGMSREFVEQRLFKPFSSTKASGMGIGTYESFQYVNELGGRIDVDSEPGRGTTVTVDLPLFESRLGSDLSMAASP